MVKMRVSHLITLSTTNQIQSVDNPVESLLTEKIVMPYLFIADDTAPKVANPFLIFIRSLTIMIVCFMVNLSQVKSNRLVINCFTEIQ